MTTVPRKVFIAVDSSEEQENMKNTRKSLKVLQKEGVNKENLIGRSSLPEKHNIFKKSKSETAVASNTPPFDAKRLRKSSLSQDSAEKHLAQLTEEDLTTEGEPSENYWKGLAEQRRIALENSLRENEELHHKIDNLEEELSIARQMIDESKSLVEVLTEMIQDNNDSGLVNDIGECSRSILNSTENDADSEISDAKTDDEKQE